MSLEIKFEPYCNGCAEIEPYIDKAGFSAVNMCGWHTSLTHYAVRCKHTYRCEYLRKRWGVDNNSAENKQKGDD